MSSSIELPSISNHHTSTPTSNPMPTNGTRCTSRYDAILLDMDGTIVDSTSAITAYWHMLASELGVAPDEILRTSHGLRAIDVFGIYRPDLATWDYVRKVEALIPTRFGANATTIPGATELLQTLTSSNLDSRWAVVSSSTRGLIEAWFHKFNLALPHVIAASEDVEVGKPHPACYELACEQLGVQPNSAIVIEDAPSGVRAAKAAGCHVIGVVTTHAAARLYEAGADCVVEDLKSVCVTGDDGSGGGVFVSVEGEIPRGT